MKDRQKLSLHYSEIASVLWQFGSEVSHNFQSGGIFAGSGTSDIAVTLGPNKTVKGTRRPYAVLKVCIHFGLAGFIERPLAKRPYLWH